MIKNENYRNKYKDYFKIDFDKNYDIHHIDFNHENNNIDNLILLPKELHNKYHNLLNLFGLYCVFNFTINLKDGQDYTITNLKNLCEVMEEITFWKFARINKYKGIKF